MQEPLFLALSFFAPYLGFSLNLQVNCSGSQPVKNSTYIQNCHVGFIRGTIQPKVNWSLLPLPYSAPSAAGPAQHLEQHTQRTNPKRLSMQLILFRIIPSISLVLPCSQGVCACYPTWTSQPPETQTDERLARDPPGSQNQPLVSPYIQAFIPDMYWVSTRCCG